MIMETDRGSHRQVGTYTPFGQRERRDAQVRQLLVAGEKGETACS